MTACGGNSDPADQGQDKNAKEPAAELSAPVKAAALSGPTGIGMAPLMDQPDQYEITIYQSPDEVVGKVLSGEVDVAAVPSNLGAVLNNKTEGGVKMLAVNTGGVLYVVENGNTVTDLEGLRGKTILASGKGGAPEYILNRLLLDAGLDPAKDVDIQWLANHADIASTLLTQEGSVALLPEPFVSVVKNKSDQVNIAVDLNELWEEGYGQELPMGTLIATKDFVENRSGDLDIFLKAYEASVNGINSHPAAAADIVAEKGIIADAVTAEQAIPRCHIVFLGGTDAKTALEPFYDVIFKMDPKSVGGALPTEEFYYVSK